MREAIGPATRILITSGTATSANYSSSKPEILNIVKLASDAAVEVVQIREKQLPTRLLFELAAESIASVAGSSTKIFVNERFDIAIAAKAHGVHLTSSSIPVDRVRRLVPEEMIVGISAHTAMEVKEARANGADYAMLGPIFETPGKGEPIGLQRLAEICANEAPFRIIGVGGIDGTNGSEVLNAGAVGFAAIRYLNEFVRIGQ